jgi:glucokinase
MQDSQALGVRLGIDLGGTKMLVLAETPGGRRRWTFPTGPQTEPGMVRDHVASVMTELGLRHAERMGVAVPGLVEGGVVAESDVLPHLRGWRPALDWAGAVVLNDGEAALVRVAADEGPAATVAAIGCGTGIVAAVQVAGHRLRQSRPFAGELGFAPCGGAGTFDEAASGAAILRRLGLSAAEITERWHGNDPVCRETIRQAGEAFGISVVTVIHLLHPVKIGLYGGTLRYPGYLEAAMAAVDRLTHPLLRPGCRVERIAEPEIAVAVGALLAAEDGR